MSAMKRLLELGQSAWLDFLDRNILTSGELERLVTKEGVRGITSNPTIFQKAVAGSDAYDAFIKSTQGEGGEVLEKLMCRDIALACDTLRAVYESSNGGDGFASIEVSPAAAHDSAKSIEEALRLWNAVDRVNLMVKIPGTQAGLRAIQSCLTHGMNINITLLFSVARYREVIEAYMAALEARLASKKPIDRIASVASFFVSRVDAKADKKLAELPDDKGTALRGRIAIANAKLAYEVYESILASDRWKRLAEAGARPQRLLWAATSPKDPSYSPLHYVEALIGRDTIDTMPPDTLKTFIERGQPEASLTRDMQRAHSDVEELAKLGISLDSITEELEDDGVKSFTKSYDDAVKTIAEKQRRTKDGQYTTRNV